MSYVNCNLCPRGCGIDRTLGEKGYCGCPDSAMVAKVMLHKWEEPALAGNGGSGAIFFGGCTLGCRYCQNRAISGSPVGTPMDSTQLRMAMEERLELQPDMAGSTRHIHRNPYAGICMLQAIRRACTQVDQQTSVNQRVVSQRKAVSRYGRPPSLYS